MARCVCGGVQRLWSQPVAGRQLAYHNSPHITIKFHGFIEKSPKHYFNLRLRKFFVTQTLSIVLGTTSQVQHAKYSALPAERMKRTHKDRAAGARCIVAAGAVSEPLDSAKSR
ncbi:hypothetical protein KGM_213074 [Danaus plexippus plexippus]|uniref:Uncharacterized protein n=1 Tax=Danaus plexippus plexippus TaxID=278856 RepID=A0A212EIL9_DANPL|nr:hypothetical protein KGM_213074 [Danaus plexippus plexippus]